MPLNMLQLNADQRALLRAGIEAAGGDPIAARKDLLAKFQRARQAAVRSNPRTAGLYPSAVTIIDRGATQPAETGLGYTFNDVSQGIFHITGSIISTTSNTIIGSQSSSSVKSSSLGRIAATVYSRYLALKLKPGTNPVRMIVDGKFLSLGGTAMGTTTGSTPQWLLYDFGSRALRQVTVDLSANSGLYGFWVEAGGKCRPIDRSDAIYASMPGDSYIGGSGAAISADNIAAQLGDHLGVYMQASPAGGTGWTTTNTSYNFGTRITNGDIETFTYFPPDIIFLMGSYNDRNGGANVAANVTPALAVLRERHPGVPIIAFGAAPGSLGPTAGLIAAENGVAAGVAAANDPLIRFVPVSTDPSGPWINGTGTITATNGTGNSDWATDADGVHPTPEGYAYLGQLYATAAAAALKDMLAA